MKKSIFRCFTMDKNVLCFYEFTCILVMCWMKLLMCWKVDNHNILNTNQDIINSCLLNTMCRCFPNETDLKQISCNELNLYKLPGKHIQMLMTFLFAPLEHTHTHIFQSCDESITHFGEAIENH
jgi:hypothetical protein